MCWRLARGCRRETNRLKEFYSLLKPLHLTFFSSFPTLLSFSSPLSVNVTLLQFPSVFISLFYTSPFFLSSLIPVCSLSLSFLLSCMNSPFSLICRSDYFYAFYPECVCVSHINTELMYGCEIALRKGPFCLAGDGGMKTFCYVRK